MVAGLPESSQDPATMQTTRELKNPSWRSDATSAGGKTPVSQPNPLLTPSGISSFRRGAQVPPAQARPGPSGGAARAPAAPPFLPKGSPGQQQARPACPPAESVTDHVPAVTGRDGAPYPVAPCAARAGQSTAAGIRVDLHRPASEPCMPRALSPS